MKVASRRAGVFLDRDGVLVRPILQSGRPYAARTAGEMEVLPEAVLGTRLLKSLGLPLVVVTNQPEVARGTLDSSELAQMHKQLMEVLPLDLIMVCPHDDADRCECRKPEPGMIAAGADALDLDLSCSVMVGDRWRDIESGRRAGCHTVFIDYGYAERQPQEADAVVADFGAACQWIQSFMAPREAVLRGRSS